ncbi:MAG TPA: hypothetical protein VH328_02735 [Burkholderiaceae bacterium]|jgi:hypothetical protein|nr:hypothetical protein [Burkholderiaceae bacterium]
MSIDSAPLGSGTAVLACIYYRVACADGPLAVARVRDFQRTLRARHRRWIIEVLVRSDASPAAPVSDALAASDEPLAPPHLTLMETYHLTALAASDSDLGPVPIDVLLTEIESAASVLAPLLLGTRHVEVFAPCAW